VLAGGLAAWDRAGLGVERAELVSPGAAQALVADGGLALDVREPSEFAVGHLPGALHIPLGDLERAAVEVPRDRPIVTYCGHGERSATAISLLERLGFTRLANLDGGLGAWQEAGLEVER
jgi:rhodanese-related sulfurtransferase